MDYLRYDPSDCGFPKPSIPPLPELTLNSLGRTADSSWCSVAADAQPLHFTRARYALTEAFRQAGVGPGRAILVPAYHCRTMLDPAIRLGAGIGLYRMRPDLSPDLDHLDAALASCKQRAVALLLPHFFGFAQTSIGLVEAFCHRHGLILIEDCSHALFSLRAGRGLIGRTGTFSVASPYKFYACADGGLLWARQREMQPLLTMRDQDLAAEIKAPLHTLQQLWKPRPVHRPVTPTGPAPSQAFKGRDMLTTDATTSALYLAKEENIRSLRWSRWIGRHTQVQRLAQRRRDNYRRWAEASTAWPHCEALFPALPDDCVPYMFALHISQPEHHFHALKQLALPIWRWDDIAASDCAVANDMRLHLLHLPCHQELSEQDMDWMIATMACVLGSATSGQDS